MKKRSLAFAVTSALLGITTQVQAAGFQLAETSATGLGRAFAGEAAIADNAAVQFRNPAMLTHLKGTQVTGGVIAVMPDIDIKGHAVTVDQNGQAVGAPVASEAKDIADHAFIPNAYISHQINDKLFVGMGVGSNFGMSTKLDDGFRGTQFGNQASITTVEINPNIAYQLNDQFSVGAGVRFVMGEGDIGAKSSTTLPGALSPTGQDIPAGTTLKYMEGDDTAWGYQVGAAWQINSNNRLGFNYRSQVDLKLKGHAKGAAFDLAAAQMGLAPQAKYAGSMNLTLPATAELASFHQLTNKLAIHTSINWTDWSTFEKLEANIPYLAAQPNQLVKQENWCDSYRFAIGTTYQLTTKSTVRAGIAYDKSAVNDKNRTMTIPEMNRYWASVGYSYQFSNKLDMDLGMTYIHGEKSKVEEPRTHISSDLGSVPFGGTFSGTTEGNVLLFGVQASYKF